jgi:hypothetical protein
LLDDDSADQILLLLLGLGFSLVDQLLHAIVAAEILDLLRTNLLLLACEGGEQSEQMLAITVLALLGQLALVLLVVYGERLHVCAFSIVMHQFFQY